MRTRHPGAAGCAAWHANRAEGCRRPLAALALAGGMLVLVGCTSTVPRRVIPDFAAGPGFGETSKLVTIPLPAIAVDPNSGASWGVLTAFLLHNASDEVSILLAPQVNANRNFGTTVNFYGEAHPLPTRTFNFNVSQSTKINYDYEVHLQDRTGAEGKLDLSAAAIASADGSARFFGFAARSPRQRETNYTDEEASLDLAAGYDLGHGFKVVVGERCRHVNILRGAVVGVPFIRQRFREARIPGVDGFTAHAQRLQLIFSTLDSPDMPTSGVYLRLSAEDSLRALGSSANYRHYDGEFKVFVPADGGRFISVARIACRQTDGTRVPFLEQSTLGGEDTLRGYGNNRFVDNSYVLLNLEERIRLFRWEIFHVTADWELAPFIDFGGIMPSLGRSQDEAFEFNPGVGVRAVIRPNFVGRLDLGFGRDGPAVFVGLGYPF